MDTTGTWILHIKSEVSYTIQHDMLPILKHPGIIGLNLGKWEKNFLVEGSSHIWKPLSSNVLGSITWKL